MTRTAELNELNDRLSEHMKFILRCTTPTEKHGRLMLASPPESRYPYVYPRDCNCATQMFRRLAGSKHQYDAGRQAFELMESMAHFLKDVISPEGNWGQRYSLNGEDKGIYKQEDNVAHGIAIVCNYLLTAKRLQKDIEDLEGLLECIDRALRFAMQHFYTKELNLFYSTTSIHESSMEQGYTCWVNLAYLYALSLATEVSDEMDEKGIISRVFIEFRRGFLHSVNELFMSGSRYVRRIDPEGHIDLRPDFTMLSPFYFGFLHYHSEMENSVRFIEKQLWDPSLGMLMRYLPFYKDFSTHIHAGNGPWTQYTAVLAQFHFWNGNQQRGDELLQMIDRYRDPDGGIPEHLSTARRFDEFMELEWYTGVDFDKEFYKPILLDNVRFDKILEEANNMDRSYNEIAEKGIIKDNKIASGGYIQFASPLMWAHAEYSRALLLRAGDWWKMGKLSERDRISV